MPTLTIRHRTTYRYRQPVAFGEHRLMLRPRDSAEQRVTSSRLLIDPEPVSLDFIQDGFGNHIGIARFSGRARALSIESLVLVEHLPPALSGTATDAFPPGHTRFGLLMTTTWYSSAPPYQAHRRCSSRPRRWTLPG